MVLTDTHTLALLAAGVLGCVVAIVHGVLVQRVLVAPALRSPRNAKERPLQRLNAALLHFSTFNWFVGGVALCAAAFALGPEGRLITGLLVGGSYLFGAVANLWSLRRLHPGWML